MTASPRHSGVRTTMPVRIPTGQRWLVGDMGFRNALFEEPRALEHVAATAACWFTQHLGLWRAERSGTPVRRSTA